MSAPERRAQVQRVSISEILDALRKAPEKWPVLRDAILAVIDAIIAASPDALKESLQAMREEIAAATVAPLELIDRLLTALKDSILSSEWGPATSSDADHA